MKLPNSKVYWADYLSYSALLTDQEICEVMKLIAMRAMSYENPQDNLQDNLQDNPQVSIQKQIQIHIQKLNQIQLDFYKCLEKSQDESAKDYFASINNGKKGGRPKGSKKTVVENKTSLSNAVDVVCKKTKNEDIINGIKDETIRSLVYEWVNYKKERKETYTPSGLSKCISRLMNLCNGDAVSAKAIVDNSMSNNYAGLYPPKNMVSQQKESVWQHNMRVMREMEEENNANENLF